MSHVREVCGELVELQDGALAVAQREGGTFLHEVVGEAIYTALWELRRGRSAMMIFFLCL